MKRIIYYLILACLVCSFTACSKLSKAAKYEAKLEECIAKRDFLSARNFYHKYAGLHLMGMGEERDQLLRKLNIAEINYVMDQSGIEDAYFLADELGAKIEYLEVEATHSEEYYLYKGHCLWAKGKKVEALENYKKYPYDKLFEALMHSPVEFSQLETIYIPDYVRYNK